MNKEKRVQGSPAVGSDNRNEAERRYGDIPQKRDLNKGGREREYQEKEKGLEPIKVTIDDKPGGGSKTSGAFGKDHTEPNDPVNVRYRQDEPHQEAKED